MPEDSSENKSVELQRAARNGNARLVKELIGKGAKPHSQDDQGWCALHAAAAEGQVAVVQDLARRMGAWGVNIQTADGRTPLYLAALDGKAETVKALLDSRADPHVRNAEGRGPLEVAELFGRTEVVPLLTESLSRPPPTPAPKPAAVQPAGVKKTGNAVDAAELAARAKAESYSAPPPEAWKKTDFAKWNHLTDEQLEAIDARVELATPPPANPSADKSSKPQRAPPPAHGVAPQTGKRRDLPYGKGRVGPPKVLAPRDANYEQYKSFLDLKDRMEARKKPDYKMQDEPLFSLGPTAEGGADPSEGNGSSGPGYRWAQTPSDVQLFIEQPRGSAFSFGGGKRKEGEAAGARPLQKEDVACRITAGRLTLKVREGGAGGKFHTILDDVALWRRVRGDASFWTIEDGKEVQVTLTKQVSEWWRCVTDDEDGGHTKIDSTKCKGPEMLNDYEGAEQQELRDFFSKQLSTKL